MLQNNRKAHFISLWLTLWSKKVFVNIYYLLLVWLKSNWLNKSKFSSGFPHSNMVRKKISEYFSARFWDVTFMTKMKSSLWISPKMLLNYRKAYFSTIWLTLWRKTFFFFYPFYWFDQKSCLNKSKFSSGIVPFQTWLEKQNIWVY